MLKWTDYAILFVIIAVPLALYINVTQDIKTSAIQEEFYLNEIIESAVDDATIVLLKSVTNNNIDDIADKKFYIKEIEPDKDKALKQFYNSLYLNLGIEDKPVEQLIIKTYLPIKMITLKDGLYFTYIDENGEEKWSEKAYYTYKDFAFMQDSDDILYFGGGPPVRTNFDDVMNNILKDEKGNVIGSNPVSLPAQLKDIDEFRSYRDVVITNHITNTLEYFTYQNSVRLNYEANYNFNFPSMKNENYSNVITNTSFIAIFNGFKYKSPHKDFKTYGFGGTKVNQAKRYIGITKYNANYNSSLGQWEKDGDYISMMYELYDESKEYHEVDHINEYIYEYQMFDSKIDAARAGYIPN